MQSLRHHLLPRTNRRRASQLVSTRQAATLAGQRIVVAVDTVNRPPRRPATSLLCQPPLAMMVVAMMAVGCWRVLLLARAVGEDVAQPNRALRQSDRCGGRQGR